MIGPDDPLWFAVLLVKFGAPLFLATPNSMYVAGSRESEFSFPREWQHSLPGRSSLSTWSEGDAVCAVTGVAFDVVDVDPRNGGNVDAERDALAEHGVTVLAEVRTPGVGAHFYVEASGRPKSNNQHGIDFQAAGGMVFVPPTIRPKYRGLGYAVIHARGLGDA